MELDMVYEVTVPNDPLSPRRLRLATDEGEIAEVVLNALWCMSLDESVVIRRVA